MDSTATEAAGPAGARLFAETTCDSWFKWWWRQTQEQVLLGRALLSVRDHHPFPAAGYGSFEEWAEKRLSCKEGQRNRLLSAGRVDPVLVENKRIALVQVAAVGVQGDWLHQTLIDLCKVKGVNLAWVGASAEKHLELHGDPAAAKQHARELAAGKAEALVPAPRQDSLETLARRARGGPLGGLVKALTQVLARAGSDALPEGSLALRALTALALALLPLLTLILVVGRRANLDLLALSVGGEGAQPKPPEPEPLRRQPVTTRPPSTRQRRAAQSAKTDEEPVSIRSFETMEEVVAYNEETAADPRLQEARWQELRDDPGVRHSFPGDLYETWEVIPQSLRDAKEACREFLPLSGFMRVLGCDDCGLGGFGEHLRNLMRPVLMGGGAERLAAARSKLEREFAELTLLLRNRAALATWQGSLQRWLTIVLRDDEPATRLFVLRSWLVFELGSGIAACMDTIHFFENASPEAASANAGVVAEARRVLDDLGLLRQLQ